MLKKSDRLTKPMLKALRLANEDKPILRGSRHWDTLEALERRQVPLVNYNMGWKLTPAGRAELAVSAEDAPMKWEPDADTPHWQARQWLEAERRDLQAKLARAEAALAKIDRLVRPRESVGTGSNPQFMRILAIIAEAKGEGE